MAKLMATQDPATGLNVLAYWIPVSINITKIPASGQIVFGAFMSKAAREAGGLIFATRHYYLTPEIYNELFSMEAMTEPGTNVYSQCYKLTQTDDFFTGASDA